MPDRVELASCVLERVEFASCVLERVELASCVLERVELASCMLERVFTVAKWPAKVKLVAPPYPLKKCVIFFVAKRLGLSLNGNAVEKIVLIGLMF